MALSSGVHTFQTPSHQTLSYHITPSLKPNAPLWIHCAIAWGPGRGYIERSFSPILAKNYTVLEFCPRCTNESSWPRDADGKLETSITHGAHDLESLRLHLNLDKFERLSGHSQSGATVQLYAGLYPERVKTLVVISSFMLGFAKENMETFMRIKAERQGREEYREAYEAWDKHPTMQFESDRELTEWFHRGLVSQLADPERSKDAVGAAMGKDLLPLELFQVMNASYAVDEHVDDILDVVARTKADVLYFHGAEDVTCSIEGTKRAKSALDGRTSGKVEFVEFEKMGHFPWLEAPVEFESALWKYVKQT